MAAKRGQSTKGAVPDILERVSRGESLRSACVANGLDASGSGFMALVRADADIAQQYARAVDLGIDCQAGEMHDMELQVLHGEIDPQAFRAAMDARKWRMARQMPKKYGDKITQEVQGADGGPIKVDATVRFVRPSNAD